MNRRLVFAPLSVILLVLTVASVDAQSAATMRVNAPTEPVQAGDKVDVEIYLENATNLGSFQFTLFYSPARLKAESAQLGPFLGSTGRSTKPLGPRIDEELGRLTYGAFTLGQQPGPDGDGVLAVVTFQALKEGEVTLDLKDIQITDIRGVPIPVKDEDGKVTVKGTFQPAEGLSPILLIAGGVAVALILVGLVIVGIGLRRRRLAQVREEAR